MSSIYQSKTFKFPEGDIVLTQEERERGTHGSAVELTRYPNTGAPITLFHRSWGYEQSAEKEAEELYSALSLNLTCMLSLGERVLGEFISSIKKEEFVFDPDSVTQVTPNTNRSLKQAAFANEIINFQSLYIDEELNNYLESQDMSLKYQERLLAKKGIEAWFDANISEVVSESISHVRASNIENKEIRCNNCYNYYDEQELEIFPDGTEYFKGCPVCKTDGYLMDMEIKKE